MNTLSDMWDSVNIFAGWWEPVVAVALIAAFAIGQRITSHRRSKRGNGRR